MRSDAGTAERGRRPAGTLVLQVDAFTHEPFAGNPAAVVMLREPRDAPWMQSVASEMNLSETAFLLRRQEDGGASFDLRWFTPAVEVDLCGHATLASAHVLFEEGFAPRGEAIRFHTRSGVLAARRTDRGEIEMDFPARRERPAKLPGDAERALGVRPSYVGRNVDDFLILLDSAEAVRRVDPDFRALRSLGVRGVMVTAASDDPRFDFVSRFFAPGSGIDEDPVTGSAHCCLGPFWMGRTGKAEMVGYQASARGGIVRVRVAGERVWLQGEAVTVLRGELRA
ncbi:MAG: PhzF family phenazine biosynthesis protein [Candidatus Eisenbacteria bacterium]